MGFQVSFFGVSTTSVLSMAPGTVPRSTKWSAGWLLQAVAPATNKAKNVCFMMCKWIIVFCL